MTTNPTARLAVMLNDLCVDYGPPEVLTALLAAHPELRQVASTPARRTDRLTSQYAAERHTSTDHGRFRRGSLKHRLLSKFDWSVDPLSALGAAWRVCLDEYGEIATYMQIETARKRVSELADAGLIEDSGKRVANEGSPDGSTAWQITTAGLQALNRCDSTGWSK